METENKKSNIDKFPVILSLIGLLADIITIAVFYSNFSTQGAQQINELSIVVIYFVLTYSWFTISWSISKSAYNKIRDSSNPLILTKSTFGVGFFVLPVSISIAILKVDSTFVFLHLLMWIVIYSSVRLLMPVIYPEFGRFMRKTPIFYDFDNAMDYIGKWECTHEYISLSSQEEFKIGDFILVYEQQYVVGSGHTELFHYNSSNNGRGLIHYSEMDTYWKLLNKEDLEKNES